MIIYIKIILYYFTLVKINLKKMNIGISPIFKKIALVPFLFFLTSCSFIDYQEKPLNIDEVHQKNKQVKL